MGRCAAQLSKRSGSNDVARPLPLETTPHADHALLDQSITYAMQYFLRRVVVIVRAHLRG
jgi:hypothetical protein